MGKLLLSISQAIPLYIYVIIIWEKPRSKEIVFFPFFFFLAFLWGEKPIGKCFYAEHEETVRAEGLLIHFLHEFIWFILFPCHLFLLMAFFSTYKLKFNSTPVTQLFLQVWPSFLTQRHFPLQWVLWIFFKVVNCPLRFYLGTDFFFFSLSLFTIVAERWERRVPGMIRKKERFPYFKLLRFHSNHKILSGSFLWVGQSIPVFHTRGLRDIQTIFVLRREECFLLDLLLSPDTAFLPFKTPAKSCWLHGAFSASPGSR